MILEEDRILLHDLKGVNLRVGFFLGTREEFLQQEKCISYSICWEAVDVRVEQLTLSEQILDLDFYFSAQQLFIDDKAIAGDVINFRCDKEEDGLVASCVLLVGRD